MKNLYLIRLDDACETMSHEKWNRIFDILDKYGVKPMVGIIPHNEDPKQVIDSPNELFWEQAKVWENKGYAIALHGYNHCYISDKGLDGMNPLWSRSEFAGVPLDVQKQKIKDGISIFKSYGINPKYFFAPSHTFDENTLVALKECSNIKIISDTIATKPYIKNGFIFIPQLGGHCAEIKIPGIWTFCLHPSIMNEKDFLAVEAFLSKHSKNMMSFDELDLEHISDKSFFSKILSNFYFTLRKIRGLK